MTLQQLRYILELSKHNSISAAAQALNISQPSLSTAIRDLEKEFSLTLVERNRQDKAELVKIDNDISSLAMLRGLVIREVCPEKLRRKP